MNYTTCIPLVDRIRAAFHVLVGRTLPADADWVDHIEINLESLRAHIVWIERRWRGQLDPALRMLDSRQADECHEHVIAAARLTREIVEMKEQGRFEA